MMPENQKSELDDLLQSAETKLAEAKALQEREDKFAAEANARFDNNLTAFRKYYPAIAKLIEEFQTREDFCLHVTQSGHGNFYPKDSDVPLYGDAPVEQAIEQVERYTQKANFSRTNYFDVPGWTTEDERIHVQYMFKLAEQLAKTKDIKSKHLTSLPPSFPTCFIFGIGLGYHIPELLKRHTFDYLFICEPDIELFFASLFCIEWDQIIEQIDINDGCLFFHLGSSYEDFFNEIFRIAEDIGAYAVINSFCYQHYPLEEVNKLIKSFFENYYQLHQGFGFYNDAITGLAHAIHNVEQHAHFLFANAQSKERLKGIPAFVVGNGPSLDKSIELIRQYQGRAVIYAGGTAFQSLQKAGIDADFHVLVERPRITFDIQKTIETDRGYANTNLLAVDVMYPDVLGLYKWTGLGLKGPEASSAFLSYHSVLKYGRTITLLPACGPMVSNTALSFAMSMGFTEIYLLGVDNGYTLEGDTHSKLSIYNDDKHQQNFKALEGAKIEFEGNLEHKVRATPLMSMSKVTFDRLVKSAPHCTVYNVGEGAKIRNTVSLREEDVVLANGTLDKPALVEELKSMHFKEVEFDRIEEKLGFKEYEELCDYLLEIGRRPYSNREEAHDILKAQQRVVYAYRKSTYPHLFHLIKGTLLYFHCPLLTLLYYFEDEEETMQQFTPAFEVWLELIEKIKADFPLNWKTKCTWSKPQYQNYDQDK